MLEHLALYAAGLSFFFTGVAGISENLRQLSGQRFRRLLRRATDHPVMAGMLGVLLGMVTQSTSAVAFLLSGMTATGLLTVSRALLVLACSNLGTPLLVFVAALDLHLPVLLLIGVSGLILAFRLLKPWRPAVASLLSIGLVFFGLDMAKQAFGPLASAPGLSLAGRAFHALPDAAFFLGLVMRTVVHSSSAAAAITITFHRGGMLTEYSSLMIVAGVGVGTAVAMYLLSANLEGITRQTALFQAMGNAAGGVLLGLLLLLEHATGTPLLMALMDHLSPTVADRIADAYFSLNLLITMVSIASLRWAPQWLAKMCPPTAQQDLARAIYLQPEALNSPETVCDLVAMEQLRVVRVLHQYMEAARGGGSLDLVGTHRAAEQLCGEITRFLEALMRLPISRETTTQVISLQRKQDSLQALEDNLYVFAKTMREEASSSETASRLVEALDTILLTASDALASRDPMEIEMAMQLTEDRGPMMERLRSRLQQEERSESGNLAALHYATTLFERNVWLLRQLALWMRFEKTATME